MNDSDTTMITTNETTNDAQNQDQQKSGDQEVFDHQDQDEEVLSLSGLILNSDEVEFQDRGRSSSADLSEVFEFSIDRNSEMSHAEDIIFCGKLIPFKDHQTSHLHPDHHHHSQPHHCTSSKEPNFVKPPMKNEKQKSFHRCESSKDRRTARSYSARHHKLMRTSRSLDSQKFYGHFASKSALERAEIDRSSSGNSLGGGRCDAAAGGWSSSKEKIPRPRWYMMFGQMRFPPEMDFRDMKSRQVRRNPGTLLSSVESDGKPLASRDYHRRRLSSWDVLRVLSCKDHASVAVTTPFGCLQQI